VKVRTLFSCRPVGTELLLSRRAASTEFLLGVARHDGASSR
jgi:hypothetical protein